MIDRIREADVQRFIEAHKAENTYQLALKYAAKGRTFLDIVLPQIRSWQKAVKKLPGWSGTRGIVWPPPASIEQSSSERTAIFKASLLSGDVCVDLTGGGGVDTFYLSRTFREVVYVEKDAELCEIAAHNFRILGACNIRVVNDRAEHFIERNERHLSAVYIDPDRRQGGRRTFRPEDASPRIAEILPQALKRSDKILIKFSPWLDLHSVLKMIPSVQTIYVVAVDYECREILCLLNNERKGTKIEAVHITGEEEIQRFTFDFEEEGEAEVHYSLPERYVYEPNAAILKAGAFKVAAERYQLKKLHTHTHLYTADRLVHEFPGRKFELLHIVPLKKEAVKRMLPQGRANLAVRNLGMSVEQVKKKLKIADGGDDYLFAVTLTDHRPALLHCRKVSD